MSRSTFLFIFGTRPEAIKLAPLIKEFQTDSHHSIKVCVTGQHRQLLHQVLSFFEINTDYDLDLMKPDQSLFDLNVDILKSLEVVLDKCKPDLVLVQGDTTTAFAGALASFYKRIKVAHVEAGLRSNNKASPFPEEINRILVGHLADYHFAPTTNAKKNLLREGISEDSVFVVGNTVIDALLLGLEYIKWHGDQEHRNCFRFLDFSKRIILVTGHRRESFGEGFENICGALKEIAHRYRDIQIVYPVHLNPHVTEPVHRILGSIQNIFLIDPVDYERLIWLMKRSHLVLTDSGGVQEEAPTLGIPVLVMREVTERTEGIEAGTAKLVGVHRDRIVAWVVEVLENGVLYKKMATAINPYGDGTASANIARILKDLT
jgi:UDP-N-acetylglucosamine 2-epimerase (non-hydrolysing)